MSPNNQDMFIISNRQALPPQTTKDNSPMMAVDHTYISPNPSPPYPYLFRCRYSRYPPTSPARVPSSFLGASRKGRALDTAMFTAPRDRPYQETKNQVAKSIPFGENGEERAASLCVLTWKPGTKAKAARGRRESTSAAFILDTPWDGGGTRGERLRRIHMENRVGDGLRDHPLPAPRCLGKF
jgi:hypothetical protein